MIESAIREQELILNGGEEGAQSAVNRKIPSKPGHL